MLPLFPPYGQPRQQSSSRSRRHRAVDVFSANARSTKPLGKRSAVRDAHTTADCGQTFASLLPRRNDVADDAGT
jgi:hypothetical protein